MTKIILREAWVDYNEDTSFFIKKVESFVLYGCIENTLLTIETKALKRCLGGKSGTTNDDIHGNRQSRYLL